MFSRLVLSLLPSRNPEASMLSIGRSAGTLSDARQRRERAVPVVSRQHLLGDHAGWHLLNLARRNGTEAAMAMQHEPALRRLHAI